METIARNLDGLRAFHAVALEGSFVRAAERLGTSKAMVSKQVKTLEAALNAQLFQRTTRKVELTSEGSALLSYSQKIFLLSGEASQTLQNLSRGDSGLIKIAAPVSLGEVILPGIISDLKRKLPQVRFEVDLSNETRDFAKDRVDFALRATKAHAPNVIARSLGRIRDVVVASPRYLSKAKWDPSRSREPRDLRKFDCILNSHQTTWNNWTFTKASEDITVEVQGSFATNQYPMARTLCLESCGIAKLPYYLVSRDLESGQLVQLLPEFRISTHPLFLVYLRSEYAAMKKKLTRDAILDWFSKNEI